MTTMTGPCATNRRHARRCDLPARGFGRVTDRLAPDAHRALHRALRNGRGDPAIASEALGADLVNTAIEVLDLHGDGGRLAGLVARAAVDGARAPVVRVDHDGAYALLTSARHLWRLVERVDELALALEGLADVCVRAAADPDGLPRLLEEVEALTRDA